MRILIEAGLILFLAFFLAFSTNALRMDGLPIKGNWQGETLEKGHLGDDLRSISLDEAHRAFEKGEAFFIDARSRKEYRLGHIKGSLSLPWEEAGSQIHEVEGLLPKDGEIITYCDGLHCTLSSDLARWLEEMGYVKVRVLVNGWSLWKDSGFPIEGAEGR